MRIQNEEFDIAFDVIKSDAENRVRQDAAADHDRRPFRPEVFHQFARFRRQLATGTDAHEPRSDAQEMVEAEANL